MKSKIYDISGKSTGDVELPDAIFGQELNNDLIHQVITSMMSNKRAVISHTKGRGEVSGGGKKPWKQKGTGRARHGSTRSPIWRGGGITFGPTKERNFSKKINQKAKNAALFQILSAKLKDGEIMFIDKMSMEEPKTKEARKILEKLSKISGFEMLLAKKKNSALILNTEVNKNNIKSFANFKNIKTEEMRKINPLDLLTYKHILIVNPAESIELLTNKLNK